MSTLYDFNTDMLLVDSIPQHCALKILAELYDCETRLSYVDRAYLYANMMRIDDLRAIAKLAVHDMARQIGDLDSRTVLDSALYRVGHGIAMPKDAYNVYKDNQNVHTQIRLTIPVAIKLVEKYATKYKRPDLDDARFNSFFSSLERSDHASLDPRLLFSAVWNLIHSPAAYKHRSELRSRLFQEMLQSADKCVTGKICCLVNALRGFGFDEFEAHVDNYEYCKIRAFHALSKAIDPTDIATLIDQIANAVNSGHVPLPAEHACRILTAFTGEKWIMKDDSKVALSKRL